MGEKKIEAFEYAESIIASIDRLRDTNYEIPYIQLKLSFQNIVGLHTLKNAFKIELVISRIMKKDKIG